MAGESIVWGLVRITVQVQVAEGRTQLANDTRRRSMVVGGGG